MDQNGAQQGEIKMKIWIFAGSMCWWSLAVRCDASHLIITYLLCAIRNIVYILSNNNIYSYILVCVEKTNLSFGEFVCNEEKATKAYFLRAIFLLDRLQYERCVSMEWNRLYFPLIFRFFTSLQLSVVSFWHCFQIELPFGIEFTLPLRSHYQQP